MNYTIPEKAADASVAPEICIIRGRLVFNSAKMIIIIVDNMHTSYQERGFARQVADKERTGKVAGKVFDFEQQGIRGGMRRKIKSAPARTSAGLPAGSRSPRTWIIAGAVLLAVLGIGLGFLISARLSEKSAYTIEIGDGAAGAYRSAVERFIKENPKLKVVGGGSPDIVIDTVKMKGFSSSVIREVPPLAIKAGDKETRVGGKKSYFLLYRNRDHFVSRLEGYLEGKTARETLAACGDIIPGRHTAEKMARHGVYYPFEKVAPYVIGSDMIFGDLECPLSDRIPPPFTGMSFITPAGTIEGMKLCGFNVLMLANNHSTNFGASAFLDTLDLLQANNIKYFGGGRNYEEAHSPAIIDVKGVRFAFLGYNAVVGAQNAAADQPGVVTIRLLPWFDDDPRDFEMVKSEIAGARKSADVVIACFHWGKEDEYYPGHSVQKMARTACDAGADLVIGTHPHSVQGLEYYNGKLIAYSLGNFVFDQMYTTQVREGIIMKCVFTASDLTGVELLPYKIYDFCQPIVLTGASGQYLLDHTLKISRLGD